MRSPRMVIFIVPEWYPMQNFECLFMIHNKLSNQSGVYMCTYMELGCGGCLLKIN